MAKTIREIKLISINTSQATDISGKITRTKLIKIRSSLCSNKETTMGKKWCSILNKNRKRRQCTGNHH